MSNQKHCRSCPHLDFNEMSDEMYCKLKDYELIRLRWHKHRPDWCPLVTGIERRKERGMNLYDMLLPESPYVFYDSDHGFCINTEDVFNLIEQLQLTGHWVPCSEMEPKKSGRYLCTLGGTGIVSPDYYTTQEQAEEWFADSENEYLDLEEYIGWASKNVIAWMPLPAEYKEG